MAQISKILKDTINLELKNNPGKYTGTSEENSECATKQVYLDNPEAFQCTNAIDMLMLNISKMA